jgi:hypothetical protein
MKNLSKLLQKEATKGMFFLQRHPENIEQYFDIYELHQEYYQNKNYDTDLKNYLSIIDTNHYFNLKNETYEEPKSRN